MHLQQTEAEYVAEIDSLWSQYYGSAASRVTYLGAKVPGGHWQGAGVTRAHIIADELAGAPAASWMLREWSRVTQINIAN